MSHEIDGYDYIPMNQSVVGKGNRRSCRAWVIEFRTMPCHYCDGPGGTIDHIIPRSKGGGTVKVNCVPACRDCNGFRADRDYQWFKDIGWKQRRFH